MNIEEVSKAFDIRPLLSQVSLGVSEGDRIGIVGRNGSGKSTLMKIIAGVEDPDAGRVTKSNSSRIGILSQVDTASKDATVGDVVIGNREKHEWASDARIREIFTGLFGGFDDHLFERTFASLSGGEKRRVGLAKLLIDDLDLILLDEPTNHLDVEGVAWLAEHLNARKDLAVLVVTHDRWFLDAVTDRTWEVVLGKVEEYDGGYSAFVLAKAERARQAGAMDARRNNLIRKELAWLRRGAPARTTKPKFRVDAANELISAEPAPRDSTELLKFALNRLGNTVFELHHAQIQAGEKELIHDLTWNVGPGDRIGIVGINGAGKTTLMRTLAGQLKPTSGKLVTGITVKIAFLTQHLDELDPKWRLLEAVEKDDDWRLIDPKSNEAVKIINARDLWWQIIHARAETGEPYMVNIDTCNEALPKEQKELGLKIRQSNLCSEITLPTNEERTAVCCLSSVNLEHFDDWSKDDDFIQDLITMLDNVLQHYIDNAIDTTQLGEYSANFKRFQKYVKEGKISMEKMVEKMSHAVATCFQIKERGYIREGYFADLVLIKEAPYTITKDNILYKCAWSPLEGTQFPYQIHSTFVNGHRVFNDGQFDESEKGQRLQFDRQ